MSSAAIDRKWLELNPFRTTIWRCQRTLELANCRPRALRPRKTDDHFVRACSRMLTELMAAGDDEHKRAAVCNEYPDVTQAFMLHYSDSLEDRETLKAWLLTAETDEHIAARMSISANVINYFEKLFFCVRDRLQNADWISIAALQPPTTMFAKIGDIADEQRWWMYRLVGYHGGALALDAMIGAIMPSPKLLGNSDVGGWFDDDLKYVLRSHAVMAANSLVLNSDNSARLIQLALRSRARPR